jgi:Protein of unknown function (DUF2855)
MSEAVDFEVRRDDLRTTRLAKADAARLVPAEGRALLRVDHFAFTANNITYAVAGDLLSYWKFFPAEAGWGRVPVWGFADVEASRCAGVREGTRFYGYYPMSTHLLVEPVKPSEAGFIDGAAHRAAMAGAYNQYRAASADLDPAGEAAQMLLQPLFTTAFLIDDHLAESGFFGARIAVLSSASSKTAFGLAHQLSQRGGVEVVGLTSPRNAAFTAGLGCYQRVLPYGELSALDPAEPALFVDMAGDGAVQSAVHHHFGPNLVYSLSVGLTHWEHRKRESGLPGAEPSFFFAPNQLRRRTADWGAEGFQQRLAAAFGSFRALSDRALRVVRGARADVQRVYLDTLAGRTAPDAGHVLSLREARG